MVKHIMRDPLFLSQKSEVATKEDLYEEKSKRCRR